MRPSMQGPVGFSLDGKMGRAGERARWRRRGREIHMEGSFVRMYQDLVIDMK